MTMTEHESWLISELITMDDRETAQLAEALLWDMNGNIDHLMFNDLVHAIVNEPTAIEFHAKLPKLLNKWLRIRGMQKESNIPFVYKCGMPSKPLTGIKPAKQ